MTRINTNLSSLTAQHILERSNASLQTSLTRLSTGLRINSGKDDPAGLIASEVLGAEIKSIGVSISNAQRGNNIVATADAALAEVSTLLSDIRGLIQASANKGALSTAEIAANQVQLDSALDSIGRIAQTTVFGGEKLLNGSKAFSVAGDFESFGSGSDIKVTAFDPTKHTSTESDDVTLSVTTVAVKANVTIGGGAGTETDVAATATIKIASTGDDDAIADLNPDDSGTDDATFTLTIAGEETADINVAAAQADAQVIVDAINLLTEDTGVTAELDDDGNVVLTSEEVGEGVTFTLTGTTSVGSGEDTILTDTLGDVTDGSVEITPPTSGTTIANLSSGLTAASATIKFTTSGDDDAIADLDPDDSGTDDATFTLTINGEATADINVAAAQADVDVVVDAINAISDDTGVTAEYDTDTGNIVLTTTATGAGTTFTVTGATSVGSGEDTILGDGISDVTDGTTGTSPTTTITVTGELGSASITFSNDAVRADSSVLVDLINEKTSVTGVVATGDGGLGDIEVSSQVYGSAGSANIVATAATNSGDVTVFNATGTLTKVNGADVAGTVTIDGTTKAFTGVGVDITFSSDAITFTAVSDPTLDNDAPQTNTFDVTGGALFQIGPSVNYSNQVNVNIEALDLDSLGKSSATGSAALSSLRSGGANELSSLDLEDAATIVEAAIKQIATIRGRLGALQKNVFESSINSLQSSLEQVTAAQSNIRDADFAAETANLTRSQILVQAGTTVLQIANASPQNVLALLQR